MSRGVALLILLTSGVSIGAEITDVAQVWAGHPVGFSLLTHAPHQFVAYYDAERRMTVASRRLEESNWTYTVLPESVGWDSHNSITMDIDAEGHIHLSGNMHAGPLVYFRTTRALDATSLERVPAMVGTNESRATYPKFMRGPSEELIFTYRDGGSGNGNQIYNRYDTATKEWQRLLDTPLVDGEGLRNAYFDGPRKGPDGFFHLCWVWRDTPDCATNHDPSYARSHDLLHWERSDGTALELPITYGEAEVIDPVPPGGGVINGNVRLGFDAEKRPVITYHKYDAAGNSQVFLARRESGDWKSVQVTNWQHRWDFSGGGSIDFEVRVQPLRVVDDTPVLQFWSAKQGTERWRMNPDTLLPMEELDPPAPLLPDSLRAVRSEFPGMELRSTGDSGESALHGSRYLLRWETLSRNRDRPRPKPWPEPSTLQLITLDK